MMFSGLLRPQRHARVPARPAPRRTTSLGGSSARTVIILVRWIITSETVELAQVEQAAEHVAVVLLDAAFVVQQVDRAAQLLVRRQERLVRRRCASRTRAGSAAPAPRSPSAPARTGARPTRPAGDQERDPVGRVDGDRLGQHLGEHHDEDRHRPRSHRARRRRRTSASSTPVASEEAAMLTTLLPISMRADQPLARLQQPVDDARRAGCRSSPAAACARARPRSARSRCPRRRTDSARQSDDDDERQPVFEHAHRPASISRQEGAHLGGVDVAAR